MVWVIYNHEIKVVFNGCYRVLNVSPAQLLLNPEISETLNPFERPPFHGSSAAETSAVSLTTYASNCAIRSAVFNIMK